jgi:hypothetical protein
MTIHGLDATSASSLRKSSFQASKMFSSLPTQILPKAIWRSVCTSPSRSLKLTIPATAAIAAGTWATAAYLDAKFHLRKDLDGIRRLKAGERDYAKAVKEDKVSLWYLLEDACKAHWNDRAIWTRERSYTFGEFYETTIKYASWMLEQGVRPGDLVAMYLINSAEFMMVWYATICIGAGPAFINYNLEGKALLHCLSVCESKLIIVDDDEGCQRRINGSRQEIESQGLNIVTLDTSLKQTISSRPATRPGNEYRNGVKGEFPYTLIYTR